MTIYDQMRIVSLKKDFSILNHPVSHMLVLGATGMGKDVFLKTCIENILDYKRVKIFDLYAGARDEGCFWALESDLEERKKIKLVNSRGELLMAKAYDTRVLIPLYKKRFPDEIPNIFKPFSIPFSSLTIDNIKGLLGENLNVSELSGWDDVIEYLSSNKKIGWAELQLFLLKLKKGKLFYGEKIHGASWQGIRDIQKGLSILANNYLLCSEKNELALDLKKEIKDYKTITTLSLSKIEPSLRTWMVNYFLEHIKNLAQTEVSGRYPIICLIREGSDIFPNRALSEQEKSLVKTGSNVLKGGRGERVFIWVNAQDPNELGVILGQCEITASFRIDSWSAMETIISPKAKHFATAEDIANIGILEKGHCYIFTPEGVFFNKIFPPRSRFFKEGDDFYKIWAREKGSDKFIKTKQFLELIEKEYNDSENKIKENYELKKATEKQRKEREELEKKEKEELEKETKKKIKVKDIEELEVEDEVEEIEDSPQDINFDILNNPLFKPIKV